MIFGGAGLKKILNPNKNIETIFFITKTKIKNNAVKKISMFLNLSLN